MLLNGKFVFISAKTRQGNDGKMYTNVSIENNDEVTNMSCDASTIAGLEKYHTYMGTFVYGSYQGKGYIKLDSVAPLK